MTLDAATRDLFTAVADALTGYAAWPVVSCKVACERAAAGDDPGEVRDWLVDLLEQREATR